MNNLLKTIAHASLMATISSSQIGQFSVQATETEKNGNKSVLRAGEKVPDGSVTGIDGKAVSLHRIISAKPTVLIFYRGGWCPYYMLPVPAVFIVDRNGLIHFAHSNQNYKVRIDINALLNKIEETGNNP